MNNVNTVVPDDHELTLLLGTYWFDFEQAAELIHTAVAARKTARQDNKSEASEDQLLDYVI